MKKYLKLQVVAIAVLVASLVGLQPALAATDAGAKPSASVTAPASPDKVKAPAPTVNKVAPKAGDTAKGKVAASAIANPPAEPDEFVKLAREILQAARDGRWVFMILLVLFLTVGVTRWAVDKYDMAKFRLGWMEWFATKWGGWTLVTVGSVSGALLVAYKAGVKLTFVTALELVGAAVIIALATAGSKELTKDVKGN